MAMPALAFIDLTARRSSSRVMGPSGSPRARPRMMANPSSTFSQSMCEDVQSLCHLPARCSTTSRGCWMVSPSTVTEVELTGCSLNKNPLTIPTTPVT
eukprot:5450627-Pyramimonas_sp.AAC.1